MTRDGGRGSQSPEASSGGSQPRGAGSTPPPRSFEEELARLEAAVSRLDGGELSLDEALAEYESGFQSLRRCYDLLEAAQGRVEILRRDLAADRIEWEPVRLPDLRPSSERARGDDGEGSAVGEEDPGAPRGPARPAKNGPVQTRAAAPCADVGDVEDVDGADDGEDESHGD